MTDGSKVPDLWELIREWVFLHFGVRGLVGLALLAAAVYAYKNWDKVSKWPGIASVISYFNRWPIPKADPNWIGP